MKHLILVCLAWVAFSTTSLAAANIDQAAADACLCMKAPYSELSNALVLAKEAQKTGDMSKLMAIQQQIMTTLKASTGCFEGLSKKYPEIDKSDELKEQVVKKTKKMCPSPVMRH